MRKTDMKIAIVALLAAPPCLAHPALVPEADPLGSLQVAPATPEHELHELHTGAPATPEHELHTIAGVAAAGVTADKVQYITTDKCAPSAKLNPTECASAAAVLGLQFNTAYTPANQDFARGCFVYNNRVYWKPGGESSGSGANPDTHCSAAAPCICKREFCWKKLERRSVEGSWRRGEGTLAECKRMCEQNTGAASGYGCVGFSRLRYHNAGDNDPHYCYFADNHAELKTAYRTEDCTFTLPKWASGSRTDKCTDYENHNIDVNGERPPASWPAPTLQRYNSTDVDPAGTIHRVCMCARRGLVHRGQGLLP